MKSIRVSGEFEGVHHWPDAPKEVEHLRNLHAHIFKVEVEIAVDHGNRYVEFFIAKRNLGLICLATATYLKSCPTTSCEDMAEYIAIRLNKDWNYTILRVVVSEPEIGDGIFRPEIQTFIDGDKLTDELKAQIGYGKVLPLR
jgi:6-pyruvoyl-tetrahydropterin synthase